MNVQQFLRDHHRNFDVVRHPASFGAQRMAQAIHVSGDKVAKAVLLKADRGFAYYLAVLPASHRLDFDKIRAAIGVENLALASEREVAEHCADCEVGALPPFGSQLGVETLVDSSLSFAGQIVFEGNTHEESIRLAYRDFYELEHPLVVDISRRT